ncbi:MAG: hypothetical protein AAF570_05320 [Bacteroidota bacterium]
MIPSDCEGTDALEAKWEDAAKLLTLREIKAHNYLSADSVEVPMTEWEPLRGMLVAVDQALEDVHCEDLRHLRDLAPFPNVQMHEMLIQLDTIVDWVQQWRAGNAVKGHTVVDAVMEEFYQSLVSNEEQA